MSNNYEGVFVFAEQKNSSIHRVTYELLGKGRELADKLDVPLLCGVFGPRSMELDELIYRGADKVYHITHDELFLYPEEMIYSKNIVKLLHDIKPEICLFGATNFGRAIAPRIAAKMEAGLTADCTGLDIDEDGGLIQIRPAFSENILAHIRSKGKPQMATVRYKEFDEAQRDKSRTGEIIKLDPVEIKNSAVKVLEEIISADINITDAEIVVVAGKGLKTPDDMKLISALAEALGGVVGASRPLVEEGYATKAQQIGYSGNRVKAKLYVACGVSGAPQHIAGMVECENIIAINSDPSAPIFKVADYGIVGNLYQVIPELMDTIMPKKNT